MAITLRELLRDPVVKGVCVGWCPDNDEFTGICAHAHHHESHGKYRGLICVASNRHYNITTVRHELCHLLRGNARHDEPFWRLVRERGGRIERQYR